jgi:uncharacterized membrane protein
LTATLAPPIQKWLIGTPEAHMTLAVSRRWYSPRGLMLSLMLRPRVYGAAATAAVTYYLLPKYIPNIERLVLTWDVGGLVYLSFAFQLLMTSNAENIQSRARKRDDGRVVILLLILLSIMASFGAIAGLIAYAKTADASVKLLLAVLAVFTIMISWMVTQMVFALHYAHDYYRYIEGSDARGGLGFANCELPDYWDFFYFSTSIGATSQTSDTTVRSRALRKLVTFHAIIAFFFNIAVFALTVNIAASLAG